MTARKFLAALTTGALCLAFVWLSACSVPPQGTKINLSRAITLSQNGNIKDVVLDTGDNVIVMTAQIPSGTIVTATTTSGEVVTIADGMRLLADIDSMNFANLESLGFVLPAVYSTSPQSSSGSNILWTVVPFVLLLGVLLLFLRPRGNV